MKEDFSLEMSKVQTVGMPTAKTMHVVANLKLIVPP